MISLSKLTEKELANPEIYERIKGVFLTCLNHLLIPESRRMADMLEQKIGPALQIENPELYEKYQQILNILKFIALITLDRNSLMKLMQFHALDAFINNLDLNDRFTGRMYLYPDTAWQDEANQIIEALKQNKQMLGAQSITLRGENTSAAPFISNWISEYDRGFGPEKHSVLEQRQFLIQNPNAKTLNEREKDILLRALQFYDNLKPLPVESIDEYLNSTPADLHQTSNEVTETTTETMPVRPPIVAPALPKTAPAEKNISTQQNEQYPPDTYREPIGKEDILGPQKPITKPAPKLDGNIVDLKEFSDKL